MSKVRVAVVGASGYSGEELLRILFRHRECEVKIITSRQYADKPIGEVFPRFMEQEIKFSAPDTGKIAADNDAMWKGLFLGPHDFASAAINDKTTRGLMEKIEFAHGGPEYDAKYPDGIPTSVVITTTDGRTLDSGLVMYPSGHARNTTADLKGILENKFEQLGALAMDDPKPLVSKLERLDKLTPAELAGLYDFKIVARGTFE